MQIESDLISGLQQLSDEFHANELAYLAATCKIEFPIRDKLAFYLHKRYQNQEFIVAREWDKIDLAIIEQRGAPRCFIELKAMYTFDAAKDPKKFTDATSADEIKAQALAGPQTSVYSLLLATHLNGAVETPFGKVVKYTAGINRAVQTPQDADRVREKAIENVSERLANRSLVSHGEIVGGSAFGLGVSVLYWLVRNREVTGLQNDSAGHSAQGQRELVIVG
jgi:hypothetical protein